VVPRRPYDERMRLLHLDDVPDDATPAPVLVVAMDGWTDAGTGGSMAAQTLRDAFPARRLGQFPPDALYDYRDRRPLLAIDRGELADPQWPELTVDLLRPPAGPAIVLVTGGEPDFAWQSVADDLVELAERLDATRYVGLGSVPGPVPHTRPIQLVSTSNREELRDRMGRPHEQMVVPASCQVILETRFRDAGLQTLGLWARVPHYVAGEFPAASRALLERFSSFLGTPVDLSVLDDDIADNRQRLDLAAEGSEEVTEHIRQLEELHDAEQSHGAGEGTPMPGGPLPSGEEIAAEVERFLRGKRE
jgi:hypothetical protein